ncbi:GGDEF domain-containing protein [Thaumasiovibrio subtropicus]|uniref:GGDEF domain-containing protein n=2 Tax=Thaumasiovibrio subtropicus TaxID=1891207 RepID=UPI001C845D61|nr:GGDEF domain-containing protein [Thaumasiovibrio subtropicus]
MDDKVIRSIIEITEQRSSDSLGYCVVATLAEMLPVSAITLYRFDGTHYLQSISLSISEDHLGRRRQTWHHEPQYYDYIEELTISKLSNVPKLIRHSATSFHYFYPIPLDNEHFAMLYLHLCEPTEPFTMLIEGFAKIYENYLRILDESERDKLTGLYNRKTIEDKLQDDFIRYEADGRINDLQSCWLVILDIDHFKRVNDNFGHLIGDEVLLIFSQQLKLHFTADDKIFRFGGEEFLVILSPSTCEEAAMKINEFRKHIESFTFPQVERITVSCGFAKISTKDYLPIILDNADKALYHAKNKGRNRFYCYEELLNDGTLVEDDSDSDFELF